MSLWAFSITLAASATLMLEARNVPFLIIALYKLSTKIFLKGDLVEKIIIRKYGAKILKIEEDHTIIQKTGTKAGTQKLYDELKKFGEILEFARSGRVALSKKKRKTINFLRTLEKTKSNKLNI